MFNREELFEIYIALRTEYPKEKAEILFNKLLKIL